MTGGERDGEGGFQTVVEGRVGVGDGFERVAGHEGDVEPSLSLQKSEIGKSEAFGYLLQIAVPSVGFIECGKIIAWGGRARIVIGIL